MLSLSDLKDVSNMLGVPTTVVVILFSAFELGWLPSVSSKSYEAVTFNSARMEQQDRMVNLVIKQHGEQMELLTKAMREICFNTANSRDRERACANLDSTISGKP